MMSKTKIFYFAYGSNLSHKQMKKRCPHATIVAKAKLQNYELAITGYSSRWRGGAATIVPQKKSEVWGVVYRLDHDCLVRLDGYEGVKYRFYSRKKVVCRFANGKKKIVLTYIREPKKLSHSSRKYKTTIVNGAKNFSLPQGYVNYLKTTL